MENRVNVSVADIEAQSANSAKTREVEVKKNFFDEKNYLNAKLKDDEVSRETKIRILPVSATDGRIAFEINTHNMKVDKAVAKSGFKSLICLNDINVKEPGVECPICAKAKELFRLANECGNDVERKALCKQAYSFQSKKTYMSRLIERGKEDEGVKFWRYNAHDDQTGCYDELMKIYRERRNDSLSDGEGEYRLVDAKSIPASYSFDESNTFNNADEIPQISDKSSLYIKVGDSYYILCSYNVFDIYNGKDLKLTFSKGQNTKGVQIKIIDSGKEKPLSTDEKQIEEWINDPKSWRDVYALKTPDYLEVIAEGGIPVYNRDLRRFVAKDPAWNEKQDQIDEVANQILENR